MSIRLVDAKFWISDKGDTPLLDVRSPAEFKAGHVPGAVNMPLFENEERAKVGTLYKQVSREAAMLAGLEIVGPKMVNFVQLASNISPCKSLGLYCWRGGMRSGSVAQLLDMAGFDVSVLQGGYKGYRRYTLNLMSYPWPLRVITGSTGSGKTEILLALRELGEQVVDLEGLANHKGSAFGGLMQPSQPSSEHMQNLLAEELKNLDPHRPIWIEDESMNIGSVFLSDIFWTQLHKSPLYLVERSKDIRIKRLSSEYGKADKLMVIERIQKIDKKLGGQSTKDAVAFVEEGDAESATNILLRYYDKAYATSIADRQQYIKHSIQCSDEPAVEIAKKLIELPDLL